MNTWGILVKQKEIEIYRYPDTDPEYDDYGELIPSKPYKLDVCGSYPQRTKWNQIKTLPENVQTRETIRLFTKEKLRMMREGNGGWLADVVIHDDDEWEVVRCEPKLVGHLNHYDVIACRRQIAPDNKIIRTRVQSNE